MQQLDFSRPRGVRALLRLYFTGFVMGAADIVPGVSGGTMAFVLGIYRTLLDAIKSFNLDAVRLALRFDVKGLLAHIPFAFLIAVGVGIGSAIFALSNFLGNALETHPTYVFAFFGGLVLASIVAIGSKVQWRPDTVIAVVLFTVIAFVVVGLSEIQNADHSLPVLFLSGAVAIMAMILPGISGSFILLILGQYKYILDSVRSLNIAVLVAVAAGCAVGIIAFSRVLSWLLKRHEQVTIAALTGFMIGSLRKIWEEASAGAAAMPDFGTTEIVIALGLLVVGFLLVSLIDHLQSGANPIFAWAWRPRRSAAPAA